MTHHVDVDTITLTKGGHRTREEGLCLLEAASYFAGETHTDHPVCVSPVLAAYGRSLNDILSDAKRQELRPLIPLLPGTAGDGLNETRGYLALDWLIRTYTPAWLDLAGLTAEATALRDFRRIADLAAARAVRPHVLTARDKAAAAWDAARTAAGDAAGDAARTAARTAAWDAARAAAGDAAGDAAWAAAGSAAWAAAVAAAVDAAWDAARTAAVDAARDAARDAAWAAAVDAAWDAAWDAARDAAWAAAVDAAWDAAWDAARTAAWDAAWDAAGDAAGDAAWAAAGSAAWAAAVAAARAAAWDILAPAVAQLQESAIALYDVLITGAWPLKETTPS